MTGQPPGGYPPYDPNQGQQPGGFNPPAFDPNQSQPVNPYGQGYQPYTPGQYPPPPQQQPYPNNGYSSGSDGNKPATLALVFGCLIFLCGIFTGIPAIVLGIIGRKKAEELGGEGRGKATAGLVLGIFNIVATIIYIGLIVVGLITLPGSTSSSTPRSNGATVMQEDVELVESKVALSDTALATYTVQIKNKTDSDTAYSVDVECNGGGETHTTTVESPKAAPQETVDAVAEVQFGATNTYLNVICTVEGMRFLDK